MEFAFSQPTASSSGDGIPMNELAERSADTGASQYSSSSTPAIPGAGVSGAFDTATGILALQPPQGRFAWVGVLTSCLPLETAIDGVFMRRLIRTLTDGPQAGRDQRMTDEELKVLRRNWDPRNRFLSGHAIGTAFDLERHGGRTIAGPPTTTDPLESVI